SLLVALPRPTDRSRRADIPVHRRKALRLLRPTTPLVDRRCHPTSDNLWISNGPSCRKAHSLRRYASGFVCSIAAVLQRAWLHPHLEGGPILQGERGNRRSRDAPHERSRIDRQDSRACCLRTRDQPTGSRKLNTPTPLVQRPE